MKTFRVKLMQTILIEIDDAKATEKSAAYLAENIAPCHYKEGRAKSLAGVYKLIAEPGAKAESVKEIDSRKK